MTSRRIANSELDETIEDTRAWVDKNPVPCPISWCNAHKVRGALCGDEAGAFFMGIHVGRVKAVKRWEKQLERRVALYKDLGVSDPELLAGIGLMIDDRRVNSGTPTHNEPDCDCTACVETAEAEANR